MANSEEDHPARDAGIVTANRFCAVAAVVCFAVALLAAIGAVAAPVEEREAGGLLAVALSMAI